MVKKSDKIVKVVLVKVREEAIWVREEENMSEKCEVLVG